MRVIQRAGLVVGCGGVHLRHEECMNNPAKTFPCDSLLSAERLQTRFTRKRRVFNLLSICLIFIGKNLSISPVQRLNVKTPGHVPLSGVTRMDCSCHTNSCLTNSQALFRVNRPPLNLLSSAHGRRRASKAPLVALLTSATEFKLIMI